MTNADLKELNLTDDQVKAVMALKGKEFAELEKERDAARAERDTLKGSPDDEKTRKTVDREDEAKGEDARLAQDDRGRADESAGESARIDRDRKDREDERRGEERRLAEDRHEDRGEQTSRDREDERRSEDNRDDRRADSARDERRENGDVETLRRRIAELEADKQRGERDQRLRSSLDGSEAHNLDTLVRLLDVDALTFTDEAIEGLEEQLAKLRESDPYLFKETEARRAGAHIEGRPQTPLSMNDRIRGSR